MNIYERYELDQRRLEEGTPIDLGDGAKIWMSFADTSNVRYHAAIDRHTRPHRKQLQQESLPPDVMQGVMRKVYAEMVVRWEGVTDREGAPIPCNRENAERLFEELPVVFNMVQDHAQRLASYLAHREEEDVKN